MKKTKKYFLFLLFSVLFSSNLWSDDTDNFTVTVLNNPSAGYLFVGPYSLSSIALIDNSGIAVHVASLDITRGGIQDFHTWSKNLATFWNRDMFTGLMGTYAVNERYDVLDSFVVSSEYVSDFHEFKLLPNGHYLVLGENWRPVDMSLIVPNGNPSARVKFNVIQEYDSNHNLVWEWNTFNHFNITDATSNIDLTLPVVNFCHVNSFFVDTDGNIILSSRLMDEITKINKSNGQIIWRMGGSRCKNNQFTFINDTRNNFTGFSHQHDVQRLSNGNLLIFDNGNLKGDSCSRAVEYELNETNKTVTKVWEYRHNPVIFTESMGSVQRLPNGNSLIGWCLNSQNLTCTEINSNGDVVFEMTPQISSYRVYRQVFKMDAVTRNINTVSNYSFNENNNNTFTILNLSSLNGTGNVQMERHYYSAHNQSFGSSAPIEVYPSRWVMTSSTISSFAGKLYFLLDSINDFQSPDKLFIYYRAKEGTGEFQKITTTFNSLTRQLEANVSGFGEYIIGLTQLEQPELYLPQNNSTAVKIPFKITWKHLFNADSYNLQISTNSDFSSNLIDTTGMKDTTFIASSILLNSSTKYYWRVNALKGNQTTSWSSVWSFTTEFPAPALLLPSDSSVNVPVSGKFSWNKVNMADSYTLKLSMAQDFSNLIVNDVVKFTDYSYENLKFNKRYYWMVSASKENYTSKPSSVWSFVTKLDTVHLLQPQNNIKNINPASVLLSWKLLDGADVYHLQISKDSAFSNIYKDIGEISDTFYIQNNFENNTEYFWRTYGSNKTSQGEWSVTGRFATSIAPPYLIQPNDKSRNQNVEGLLKWENNPTAEYYHLQLAKDLLFKSIIQDKDHYIGNTYSYQNLSYDTKYYWRVSIYKDNDYTNWSEIWEFQTRQEFYIDKPILKTPTSEEFNLPVIGVLTWGQTPNANSYRVQVALDNIFSNFILDKDGLTKTEQEYGLLNYNTQYFWRVLANGEKAKSDWSDPGVFYTKLETPKLLVPSDGTLNIKKTTHFYWNLIDGATSYIVQFTKDDPLNQKIEKTVNNNSITKIDWLLGFTKYFWKVKGSGGKKESDWSNEWSFTTDDFSAVNEIVYSDEKINLYPNPFNDQLNLILKIFPESEVQISIFNSDGRLIQPSICQKLDNGIYQVNFRTDGWIDGIYLIKIMVNSEQKVLKAVRVGKY